MRSMSMGMSNAGKLKSVLRITLRRMSESTGSFMQ